MECITSAFLPVVLSENEHSTSGDVIHDFLHALRRGGRAVALAAAPEASRKALERIDTSQLPQSGDAEVTLAWDWVTRKGRVLGMSLGRNYSAARPTEFVCTADVFEIDGVAKVGDYKSGFMFVEADTWQMKLGCVAGAAIGGVDVAESTIYRIRGDETSRFTERFDGLDLDMFADELADLARRLAVGKVGAVVEGEHCRYCPGIRSCPAKREAVSMVAGLEKYRDAEVVPVAELGRAYLWLQSVKKMVPLIETSLKQLAQHAAIPVGEKALREVMARTETVDAAKGLPIIAAQWPAEAARLASYLSEAERTEGRITKTAIEQQFKKAIRVEVYAALQAGGAVIVTDALKIKVI